MSDPYSLLVTLWTSGVAAVSGRRSVAQALSQDAPFAADIVIAVGKAACSMFHGARPCITSKATSIIVSKYGHIDADCRSGAVVSVIESGHPIPDRNSIAAGETILQMIANAGPQDQLLLLISGGASAVAEALQPGHDLDELQAVSRSVLSSGASIAEINKIRGRMSRIKNGRLLGEFHGREARVYAISDVQGDEWSVIGGGIGDSCRASAMVRARIVASNSAARTAVSLEAETLGIPVRSNEESLYTNVMTAAEDVSALLADGLPGIYIWGGEPTIELPENPGTGGRNQSLALAIATRIKGMPGISVLVAGTDGTDGPTDVAGAFVDGRTVDNSSRAEDALRNADAGSFLAGRDCLFRSGPTGTNVMDLVIAIVT
jgi:hydroxypyruvate reductase